MGPSEKSYNQVKAILGKLDRNIDQLRERRTNKAPLQLTPAETTRPVSAPKPPPPEAAAPRPGSVYGKAKPLPPARP